ncbi:uncharacterized protein AMSG_04035 [Thecamonas trahens ATCC 50062]|uniref:Ras-GAP domain-containing protein n=1 Tax=Thecamonas trahens ATCC 50062 TaxID=461836 RepID=A0A0L0D6T2_THETB|nr:hypothetical protein AMSG_04035 [Thecamonas trahens ATCC 50062]KNC47806.1 hypothetical protein AMSG_04035 [Thecamonas trahens ATCC 50062]|eukprot:XP_013759284.1 hypothetical protein AMSG_04035 [Thecamonas trahens ATCC 50062]
MAASQVGSKLAVYEGLLDVLLDDEMQLVEAIVSQMDICDADKLAKIFVHCFESRDMTLQLLERSVTREIEKTEYAQVLFRGNSLASKMMTVYSRLVGTQYLRSTLWPVMSAVVESETSFEVDPNRARDGEDLTDNLGKVRHHVEAFLAAILDSIDSCPTPLRKLCAALMASVDTKFPESHFKVVGGYFFLRYLCPAVVSPPAYSLMDSFPKKTAHRGLVLIAKSLQNLANNVPFSANKERYLLDMNDFIEANVERLNEFFEALATVDDEVELPPPADIDAAKALQVRVDLQRYLSANYDNIVAALESGCGADAAVVAQFADVMQTLQQTVAAEQSKAAKAKGESATELDGGGGDDEGGSSGNDGLVLNMELEWTEKPRDAVAITRDLLSRLKNMAESAVNDLVLSSQSQMTLAMLGSASDTSMDTPAAMIDMLGAIPSASPGRLADMRDPYEWSKIANSIDFSEFMVDTAELQKVDLAALGSRAATIAFWINVYNMLVLHTRLLVGKMPTSVFARKSFFSNYKYNLGGHLFSLDDIYHGVLRGNPRFQIKRRDERVEYVISAYDPRVHFGVSQLNASSPVIRIMTAETVFRKLLWAAITYCNREVSVSAEKRGVTLPKLFSLYATDFGPFKTDVWSVLGLWLNEDVKDVLSSFLKTGKYKISYKDMDYGPKVPVFETDSGAEAFAVFSARKDAEKAASESAAPGSSAPAAAKAIEVTASTDDGSDEIESVVVDLDELFVVNVEEEWNDEVRPAVAVSIDLVTHLGRLVKTFMYGWTSVAGSRQFRDFVLVAGELQKVSLAPLSANERKCFFINIYNTLVTHLYIMCGPPTSIFSRKSFFKKFKYNIGGYSYTLNDIYHGILRCNRKKMFKKSDPRLAYSIPPGDFDPRIHFACSNLTESAGPVRVYHPATIDVELDAQVAASIKRVIEIKPAKNKIYLPKIIDMNLSDFVKKKDMVYDFFKSYLDADDQAAIEAFPNTSKKLRVWYRDWQWAPDPQFLC